MIRHPVRSRSARGQALVLALAFTTLFGVLAASVLSLVGTNLSATRVSSEARAEQYAADAGAEAALQAIRADQNPSVPARKGADGGAPCDLTLPASPPAPAVSVACTPDPGSGAGATTGTQTAPPWAVLALGERSTLSGPYNSPDPNDPGQVEAGIRYHEATGSPASGTVRIDGDVHSNSTIALSNNPANPSGGVKSLSARGELTAVRSCDPPGQVSETFPGNGKPVCSNLNGGGVTTVADPGYPRRTDVNTVEQPVPLCPPNPDNKLVVFTPGRYSDAVALSNLFTSCKDHDFWFKPGAYLFNFTNGAAGTAPACPLRLPAGVTEDPANTAHRWCIGARTGSDTTSLTRVLGGTPAGWNPREASEPQVTLRAANTTSPQPWVNLPDGRVIDGAAATASWIGSSAVLAPSAAAASSTGTTADWTNVGNGTTINASSTTTSWPVATTAIGRGTAASSATWSSPTSALVIEGTTRPNTARVNFSAASDRFAQIGVTGFGVGTLPSNATIVSVNARIRHAVSRLDATTEPQLVVTTGPGKLCGSFTLQRPAPASTYVTETLPLQAGCFGSGADVTGAAFTYGISRCSGCPQVTANLDGIELDVTYVVPGVRSVTLSKLTPTIPDPGDPIGRVSLAVAHGEPLESNPRIRVTGPVTCGPFPLPEHSAPATDNVDLSGCLTTAAQVNSATVVFDVDRPPGAGTASLDGMRLTVTYANNDRSITLSGYPSVPNPVDRVDRANLRVTYAAAAGTTPQVRVQPGGGAPACNPLALPAAAALTSVTLNLASCLNTAAKLNGVTVSYDVLDNGVQSASAALDGMELDVVYKLLPDRIPDLGLGCNNSSPGVQWIFAEDSRVRVVSGTTTLCTGPTDNPSTPQRIGVYGIPANAPADPVFTPAAGCRTALPNFWSGLGAPDCAVLSFGTSGTEKAQVNVKGTVYAPSDAVDMMDLDIRAPVFDRGVVVRHLRVRGFAFRSGYTGHAIANSGYVRPASAVRTFTLVSSAGRRAVVTMRARVEEDFSVNVLSWQLRR